MLSNDSFNAFPLRLHRRGDGPVKNSFLPVVDKCSPHVSSTRQLGFDFVDCSHGAYLMEWLNAVSPQAHDAVLPFSITISGPLSKSCAQI